MKYIILRNCLSFSSKFDLGWNPCYIILKSIMKTLDGSKQTFAKQFFLSFWFWCQIHKSVFKWNLSQMHRSIVHIETPTESYLIRFQTKDIKKIGFKTTKKMRIFSFCVQQSWFDKEHNNPPSDPFLIGSLRISHSHNRVGLVKNKTWPYLPFLYGLR